MRAPIFYIISFLLLVNCTSKRDVDNSVSIPLGEWRAAITISRGQELPFYLTSRQSESGDIQFIIRNNKEEIVLEKFEIKEDSLVLPLHIFDTKIVAKIEDKSLKGYWTKNYLDDYTLLFYAELGKKTRFKIPEDPVDYNFSGRWDVRFTRRDSSQYPAVGEFKQDGHFLTGSFLTNSGDYRFLEGALTDEGFKLSTFDGEHAYLFEAKLKNGDTLKGEYWSGKTGYYPWLAVRNEQASLEDPYAMTPINTQHDITQLALPNEYGDTISPSDEAYRNKVVILQILGSWCANCMDETAFLSKWYQENRDRRVEIIGLAFERKNEFKYGASRIKILKDRYDIDYEILFAGKHGKENVMNTLPMLEDFRSFPTTILLDKNGEIAKIHTGFTGPATGEHHTQFVASFNSTVDSLLEK